MKRLCAIAVLAAVLLGPSAFGGTTGKIAGRVMEADGKTPLVGVNTFSGTIAGSSGLPIISLSRRSIGPASASTTVMPLKKMARLAVAPVAAMASILARPRARSSSVRISSARSSLPEGNRIEIDSAVTARDANGNPIQGATVTLAASGSGNTLTQPGLTNASGVATGTLSSTVAESKTTALRAPSQVESDKSRQS